MMYVLSAKPCLVFLIIVHIELIFILQVPKMREARATTVHRRSVPNCLTIVHKGDRSVVPKKVKVFERVIFTIAKLLSLLGINQRRVIDNKALLAALATATGNQGQNTGFFSTYIGNRILCSLWFSNRAASLLSLGVNEYNSCGNL